MDVIVGIQTLLRLFDSHSSPHSINSLLPDIHSFSSILFRFRFLTLSLTCPYFLRPLARNPRITTDIRMLGSGNQSTCCTPHSRARLHSTLFQWMDSSNFTS